MTFQKTTIFMYKIRSENPKGRDLLEDTDIVWRITLKWILKVKGVKV
jgi:hypothetical protein